MLTISLTKRLLVVALPAAIIATGCSAGTGSTPSGASAPTVGNASPSAVQPGSSAVGTAITGTITVSGSSTVEPISTAVAELVKQANPGFNFTVTGPGTGDGFKLFCAGETDISDASRKIKDEEAATCAAAGIEYIELKIAL